MNGTDCFSELRERIETIPLVDIHSHIDGEHPSARDPKEIIFYHYIVTELLSAGAPSEVLFSNLKFDDLMEKVAPYFKMIRNTSTYWCLIKMLREIYGFEDTEITEKNWRDIKELIVSHADEEDWYRKVLRKVRLEKGFLTFRFDEEIPRYDSEFYVGALRIEPLISRLDREDITGLEKTTETSIESLRDFEDALPLLFKRFSECVAVTASILPDEYFIEPKKEIAEEAFKKRLDGSELGSSEKNHLRSYAMHCMLKMAEEYRLPFQLMLGVRRPIPGASPPDYAIVGFETKSLITLCPLFDQFKEVKFDIILANRVQSHELAVIAKNYPNVYTSGYWWYAFYPTIIQQFIKERLQMLPRNKMNGFFSDAYVVEWTYAKACMVKLQVSKVLSEMVNDGYYSKELAVSLAEDLLLNNPKRLYRLR